MLKIKKLVVGPLYTNSYIIIYKKEGIIIDPGDEAYKILSAVEGIAIKCILLTHNHFDHTQAVKKIKDILNIKCGIHPLDKTEDIYDFEIKDYEIINLGEKKIKVIHTPGHTKGSCCFLIENCLFSGDTVFAEGYGRTDLNGGSEVAILDSIEKKILTLPDNIKVYPGHGEEATIKNIKEFMKLFY